MGKSGVMRGNSRSPERGPCRAGFSYQHTRCQMILRNALITDPPYYDAVPYADLSDFFYVWLKRSFGDLYPEIC